jgi:hypothetical protein
MWVVKTHGETFYVDHVTASIPWSTKETPDNYHTKGSIKFRECLLTINDTNEAEILPLTIFDKIRLRNQKLGITRIIFSYGSQFHDALSKNEFKHSPFKNIRGGCGSSFVVCDLLKKEETTFAALKYKDGFRIMKPNEAYYKAYDGPESYIDEDDEEEYEDLE